MYVITVGNCEAIGWKSQPEGETGYLCIWSTAVLENITEVHCVYVWVCACVCVRVRECTCVYVFVYAYVRACVGVGVCACIVHISHLRTCCNMQ